MGQPVVHFEIIGADPERLRNYYGALFGWEFDTSSSSSSSSSSSGYAGRVLFYVGVPDVEAALQEAERLGGVRMMGPETGAR